MRNKNTKIGVIIIATLSLFIVVAIAGETNAVANANTFQTDRLHGTLEIIQTITNLVIAIIAAIGLRQIVITRGIARMNAKREAFKLAGEQTTFYLTQIIPLQNELDRAIRSQNVTFFKVFECKVADKTFKGKFIGTQEDVDSLIKILPELTKTLNAMEAFALFFTQGVANEKAAFSSVGETFCKEVRQLSAALKTFKAGEENYKNLTELFFIWNDRIESQKLSMEQAAISKKLSSISPGKIDILGADV